MYLIIQHFFTKINIKSRKFDNFIKIYKNNCLGEVMSVEERKTFLINTAFFILVGGIVYVFLRFMLSYLFPFLIGLILAYILQKPSEFISEKVKISKNICAPVLVGITYIAVLLFIGTIIWIVSKNMNFLAEGLSKMTKSFALFFDWLKEKNHFGKGDMLGSFISDSVDSFLKKIIEIFSNYISITVQKLPGILLSSVVTVVASCYIAKDFDVLKRFFKNLVKKKTYENIVIIKKIVVENVFKFSAGYLLLLLITFIELLIGLFVLRVDHFVIIAILISIVDVLPVLGTGTVMLPWALFSIIGTDTYLGIGLIVLYLIITVIRNFLEPKIIGKKIGINPLFTLIAIFVGLKVAGIVGMFILPITLIVVVDYYKLQMKNDIT